MDPSAPTKTRLRLRDHVIAAFVLVHLVLVLPGIIPKATEGSLLGPVGELWNEIDALKRRVSTPYGNLIGPKQGWRMFGFVGKSSPRLSIDIRTRDGWQRVYSERSDEHVWRREIFDTYRWREAFRVVGRGKSKARFFRLVTWLGPEIAEDFPEACEVRVQIHNGRMQSASALRAREKREFPDLKREGSKRVKGRRCRP